MPTYFAIDVAPLGELADPRELVRLAVAAEAAGWDGFSTWDSLGVSMGAAATDPFVALAAVASATTRLRLILSVVALPRRRPQLVAQPGALRRASRWDGWIGIAVSDDGSSMVLTPDAFGAMIARLNAERAAAGRLADPFDVALFAVSEAGQAGLVREYADAGATWWLESLSPLRGSIYSLLTRIEAGPPR